MLFISTFKFRWPNPSKDSHGSNRGYSCSFKVANSTLVQHFTGNVVPGTIFGDLTQRESNFTTKKRGTEPLVVETNIADRESLREVILRQGFDNDTVTILMASWRRYFLQLLFIHE